MGWTGNDEGLRSSRDLQLEQSLGAVLHRTSVDRLHLVKVGHVCRLQQVNRGGTAHVLDQQEITKVKKVCSNVAQSPVHQTTQSTLHFTPGRPVHSNANVTYLGSIQPHCNYCDKTICAHIKILLKNLSF